MESKVKNVEAAQQLETEHYKKTYSSDQYWNSPALIFDINHRIDYVLNHIRFHNTVLDIGCGGGGVLNGIADKIRYGCGFDISKEGIKYAMKNKKPNTTFYVSTVEDAMKQKTEHDVVLFFECLEHLYDGENILKNMHRFLVSGGLLIMSTPNYNRLIYKLQRGPIGKLLYAITKNDMFRFKITHSHIKEFSVKEVKKILNDSGFTIVNRSGRILWTDPLITENVSLLQKLNIYLGNLFPNIAGYMYIVARLEK